MRPHLLHHVERKAGVSWTVGVEKPHRRVEADGFERGLNVVAQQRIDEGQHGVRWIERRPARATVETERFPVGPDKIVEDREIILCGDAFVTARLIDGAGASDGRADGTELVGPGAQFLLALWLIGLPRSLFALALVSSA